MESVTTYDYKDEESSTNGGITFDVESGRPVPTGQRKRRLSIHRRLSENSLFEKVPAENVLPIAFKTISHRIDDANEAAEKLKFDEKVKEFSDIHWHIKESEEVAKDFSSDVKLGLTASQHEENLKVFGSNVQSKPPSGLLRKILINFFGGFGLLLMIGGILCCVSWKPLGEPAPAPANLALGVILFIVFLAQASFNFVQDFSSSKVMESIHDVIPADCKVIREGKTGQVQVKDLVPGELVLLETGTKVPADIRIVDESPDLAFDRSVLTGESKPIHAMSTADKEGANYLESHNIAMQGTFCISGSGRGIVVSTGDATVFGNIAHMSSQPKSGLTPLQSEILRFVLIVVVIIVALVVLVVILWAAWIKKSYPGWISTATLIVDIVSIAVAFIPEGLPIALTSCLIITAGAMKKHKILCKSLAVVETLGSVSVLCSDKTGTLTKNKMFVTDACLGTKILPKIDHEKNTFDDIEGIEQFYSICGMCNTATFDSKTMDLPIKDRIVHSNATDQAILRLAESIKPTSDINDNWERLSELTFNSKDKFMARIYRTHSESIGSQVGISNIKKQYYFTIKGAPDILLGKCSSYLDGSLHSPLTETVKNRILEIQSQWANQGKRVLLLASRIVSQEVMHDESFWKDSNKTTDYLRNLSNELLTLVGMVGIADLPKDDIPQVVSTLQGAGIKVAMVTGDFELTAVAIARMCGIVTHRVIDHAADLKNQYEESVDAETGELDRSIVVTSKDLATLSTLEWDQLAKYSEIVFARATPEQKLRIVEEFQCRGHIVGMTGDGVNDAPSLKQADVGIAMANGSDIAKEASDLVLLDSFSSIVEALRYGRLVFENLKKTIAYLLPAGTYAELWPVLLNVIFGLPQALSSFCMIIICCLTDCAGAITLAYESPERNLLLKKPRSVTGERLVDMKLFLHSYFTIGTFYSFTSMLMCFLYFQHKGIPFKALTLSYGNTSQFDNLAEVSNSASSVYFVNLVIMQFFNLMAVRTRYLSIFQHPPIWNKETKNYLSFLAIAFALAVTFFFNYIPWFNKILNTGHVPVQYYFIAVAFGCAVLLYDELRKYLVRKYPTSILAKIAW